MRIASALYSLHGRLTILHDNTFLLLRRQFKKVIAMSLDLRDELIGYSRILDVKEANDEERPSQIGQEGGLGLGIASKGEIENWN